MRQVTGALLLALLANACNRSGDPESNPEPSPRAASQTGPASAALTPPPVRAEKLSTTTAVLRIEGMVCESCAQAAQKILTQVEGVHAVEVDFQHGTATVQLDPARTNVDQLARSLEQIERSPAPPFRVISRDLRF